MIEERILINDPGQALCCVPGHKIESVSISESLLVVVVTNTGAILACGCSEAAVAADGFGGHKMNVSQKIGHAAQHGMRKVGQGYKSFRYY